MTASFTAPIGAPVPNVVTITATPLADPSKAASTNITVVSTLNLSVAPTSTTVALGASASFTATVSGAGDNSVQWDVNGVPGGNSAVGTILTAPGNTTVASYTAPATLPATNPVTIRARSNADLSVSAVASISLTAGITLTLSPASATLSTGHRQTFTPQLLNSPGALLTWQVNGVAAGNTSVGQVCVLNSNPCQPVAFASSAAVDYLAPSSVPFPNPVTITVSSQQDPAKTATSNITILPHIVVSVSPPSATLAPGARQLFSATVMGTTNQQVTWSLAGAACTSSGACGTTDATGLYQAPAVVPVPNNVSVVATSSEDTSRTAAAAVTLARQPVILSLSPASSTAGAAGGFTLRIRGGNFAASSPGPASSVMINGGARVTSCISTADCTTTLGSQDLALAANLTVAVQNPDGSMSNAVAFAVTTAGGAPDAILLTPGAPAATGKDITVVDLSTSGSFLPLEDVDLNIIATGAFSPATGSCTLAGGAIVFLRPASGTASADLCAFSVSGLDPSLNYSLSGPSPADIVIVGKEPLGLGIIHLTFQLPSSARIGARTLFVQNANLDVTAASGAIEIR
jgi:hypothetical protein